MKTHEGSISLNGVGGAWRLSLLAVDELSKSMQQVADVTRCG